MLWIIEKYVKYLVLFALLWGFMLGYGNFGCVRIQGKQMEPLLREPENVLVHLQEREFSSHDPQIRQDVEGGRVIVAYQYQIPGSAEIQHVGRVVGLPGDRIRMERDQLFRNGTPVGELYLGNKPDAAEAIEEITIPRDHVYLLIDNRKMRPDSRTLGPIPQVCITGRIHR